MCSMCHRVEKINIEGENVIQESRNFVKKIFACEKFLRHLWYLAYSISSH